MKEYVLVFVFDSKCERVLMIRKSAGWQNGMLNGLGGKVEAGEVYVDAVVREVREESGLDISMCPIKNTGAMEFIKKGSLKNSIHIEVFSVDYGEFPAYFSHTCEEGVVRAYEYRDIIHHSNFVPHVLPALVLSKAFNIDFTLNIFENYNKQTEEANEVNKENLYDKRNAGDVPEKDIQGGHSEEFLPDTFQHPPDKASRMG